jgi:hypothetical protein
MTIFTAPAAPAAPATMTRESWMAAVGAGVAAQRVEWTSDVRPAAAHKGVRLSKITRATAMTGVSYAALAENVGRETGALPWGEWVEGLAPWVITHKGRDYARLYVVEGSISTTYMVEGRPVSRDVFEGYLTPGARKAKRPVGGTITVKMDNLRVL